MFYLFLATYGMVLPAELIGDKAIYTISTLATRYRPLPVFYGIVVAFMGKMLVAVLVGQAIAELPAALVSGLSAATFFTMALIIWLKKPTDQPAQRAPVYWPKAVIVAFAAIFFSEWGDMGQITAGALAAAYQAPFTVWLAATLAMVTKGILAITLGRGLRKRVSEKLLRYASIGLCLALGILSALRIAVSS